MPGKTINTDQPVYNSEHPLPLQGFFTTLRLNGFLVTPEQIADANRIITHYASQVKNEGELCNYLSPLFVRNEEEQLQFEELFKAQLIAGKELLDKRRWNLKQHLNNSWWIYLSAITIIVALLFIPPLYNNTQPVLNKKLFTIFLYDKNDSTKKEEGWNSFQLSTNEKLEVYPKTQYEDADSNHQIRLSTKYSWGDLSKIDTIPSHTYQSDGEFKLTAYVSVYYKNNLPYTDTITQQVFVCKFKNTLKIIKDNQIIISRTRILDSVRIGEKITLKAITSGPKPDSIKWNSGFDSGYGNTFTTNPKLEGGWSIICKAYYGDDLCSLARHFFLLVYDPDKSILKVSLSKSENAVPVTLPVKVKPYWFYLTSILSLLSLIVVAFLFLRKRRNKNEIKQQTESIDEKFNKLLLSFSGKKYPAELPFQNKNYLPVPEAEINEAATQMRRRINNDAFFLQIQKTIETAIKNLGFFQPIYQPRLQQSEYLVLIDASHNNNQQVKLFDYLVDILKKQNVFIEKYYYRYEPNLCYNIFEPGGISLEKLSEKYHKNILLIFGNAYQLLYQFYPVFNNEYLQLLNRWQYKAVITPVSFADWGNKETQALLPQIPVVPVDVQGQLCLMEILFTENYDITAAIKQYQKSFYKVAPIDFENIQELKSYCYKAGWANVTEDGKAINILFQWLAALSVYPKIKWEITLAIGKAILDKYDKTPELNFTSLLRIARIKWMKDGQFPDYTRLDLLKELTEGNEIIARETILSLLKEIPENEIPEKHFAYEEKEIQRISNEFILYAYNPVKYAGYEQSRNLYEKLYLENKITDAPSRIYLKNDQSEWGTPIHKTGTAKQPGNVPLKEYFQPEIKTDSNQDRISLLIFWICMVIFLLSFIGLIALAVLNILNTDNFPAFTYKSQTTKNIRFKLINNADVDTNRISLTINSVSDIRRRMFALPLNDSLKYVSVKFDGNHIYDTALQVSYDSYDIHLNVDTTARHSPDNIVANLLFSVNCGTDPANFAKIIHDVDNAILVKDSLVSSVRSNANCLYLLTYGANVAASKIDSLLKNFTKNGIDLRVDMKPENLSYQPNQIYIYPSGLSGYGATVPIFIQYNNRDSVNKARQLMKCLNGNIYNVKGVEYQSGSNYYYRSEIRYFEKRFADSISRLQSCLKAVYPDKVFVPVFVKANPRGANLEIWIYDSEESETSKGNTRFLVPTQSDKMISSINIMVINSGEKVTTNNTSSGRVGLFLKDSKGDVYGICSAPVFPAGNVQDATVRLFSSETVLTPIGKVSRQSAITSVLGLIKLENADGKNSVAGRTIIGYRSVTKGQQVFLYDPSPGKGETSTAKGVVTNINYNAKIFIDKTSVSVNNVFSCDIKMNAGLSGSVLLDKDNYALGILVGGTPTLGIFIPIKTILKEFNMELLTEKSQKSY